MPRLKEVTHILGDWMHAPISKNEPKPAEVFDTHPLSEMILSAESEVGKSEHMVLVENAWKSEWHKNGVQVPVQAIHELTVPKFKKTLYPPLNRKFPCDFSPDKLWHEESDSRFDPTVHCLTDRSRRMPVYHIDDLDRAWIATVNEERDCLGETLVCDWMLEEVIETLEHLTFIKMQEKIKELEGEALEFDENARCDICLSYEGEDGNELVFCDGCFLCVHQACYGISQLPEGSWICRRCEAGVKSTIPCSLCPNTGGAMKISEDGTRWCHISCALWVPEVGFGNVELMEPVVRLDNIPQARRSLLCCICRSRYGAPIQCYNKKCKVAFHVTCAFQSNLTMRQELTDKDVRLVGLCPKHSRKDQHQSARSPSKGLVRCSTTPMRSPSQSPSHNSCGSAQQSSIAIRKQRLLELENDFHKLIDDQELVAWLTQRRQRRQQPIASPKATRSSSFSSSCASASQNSTIPENIRLAICAYWRLKRRANFNQPLVNPAPVEWRETATEVAATTKEALAQAARVTAEIQAFDAFRRIRFGLDRARLVLDMVLKRERRKLALFKRMMRISEIQLRILMTGKRCSLSEEDRLFISTVHVGDSVYDNAMLFSAHSSTRTDALSSSTSSVSQIVKENQQQSVVVQSRLANPAQKDSSETRVQHDHPLRIADDSAFGQKAQLATCDLSTIPREQFVVSEDIKRRLRSALALVSTNHVNSAEPIIIQTKPPPESKDPNVHTLPAVLKSTSVTRSKRSFYATNTATGNSSLPSCFSDQNSSDDFVTPTPSKRARRHPLTASSSESSSPSKMLLHHTIPVLSKFATIRLGPGAVRLV